MSVAQAAYILGHDQPVFSILIEVKKGRKTAQMLSVDLLSDDAHPLGFHFLFTSWCGVGMGREEERWRRSNARLDSPSALRLYEGGCGTGRLPSSEIVHPDSTLPSLLTYRTRGSTPSRRRLLCNLKPV